jgi:hypothetical protein
MITLFFGFYFDGKVGTPKLTKPTTDAVLWSQRRDLVLIVQFQHLFRAKLNTYSTSLAPIPVDMMLF